MKKILTLLLFLSSGFLYAQNLVVPMNGQRVNKKITGKDCFYYMLPKTAFQVEVTIVKTKEMQGYYGEYAKQLLGLSNIVTANKASYELKEVRIAPIAIPDTNHFYMVQMSNTQIKEGLMKTLYSQKEAMLLLEEGYTVFSPSIPEFFRNYVDLAYIEKDDSFLETKIVDGVVTQIPVNRTKMVSKTMAQQAQEAADFIAKIRNDKYDLLSGEHEIPYSKEAVEYMVDQLNQLEQNYLSLFTGFTIEEEEIHRFWVIPDERNEMPLFSVDSDKGFSKTMSPQKEQNYYLSIIPLFTNHAVLEFESQVPPKKKDIRNGYRVRKAVPCKVSLLRNGAEIYPFGVVPIYQKGYVNVFPAGMDHFKITDFVIIY